MLIPASLIWHREAICSLSPDSPASSGTERPAHACSDLGGAGGHTALAVRLSWLPGLGVVTGMPGWPVQRGERKEPEKANAPALSGHIPDTRVQVLRHSDKLITL